MYNPQKFVHQPQVVVCRGGGGVEASEHFKGEGEDGAGGRDGGVKVGVFVVMKVCRSERVSSKVVLVSWVMVVGIGVEDLGGH